MLDQNLPLYRIFYEVAKTGNISKAAKELYISQPAISKSISRLENNLQAPLFLRSSRGVQLTDEGQLLFKRVRAAFEELENGEFELRQVRQLGIGRLRIGVSATLCKYVLVPYLKEFIAVNPHYNIIIDNLNSAKTLERLEQGQIDIGLVAEPVSRRGIVFYPVQEIEDCFVATKTYLENLKLREANPDLDYFRAGNIMLLDRDNVTRQVIDAYFLEHQIETGQLLEVTTMDLLIEFSRIGLGIGCVIKEFVKEDLACGRLVEIPLKAPFKKRLIGFAHTNQPRRSRALKTFLEYYENHNAENSLRNE